MKTLHLIRRRLNHFRRVMRYSLTGPTLAPGIDA